MCRQTFVFLIVAAASAFSASVLAAPDVLAGNTLQSLISDNAMSGVHGAIMTNMAAGSNNLQANVASIIMSPNGQGVVAPSTAVRQTAGGAAQDDENVKSAEISGHAFSGTTGIMAINQASGANNAESNQLGIVLGATQQVANNVLASNLSGLTATNASKTTKEEVSSVAVANTAFKGAGGIAQVNQVSGSGNASANSFALGVAPGVIQ